jgi:predicted aspartyl protease
MDGRIGLPVRLNGEVTGRFRLDTGASRTVLSASLARRLCLGSTGASRTVTQTGEAHFALTRVARLELAPGRGVSDLIALIVPDHHLDAESRVDGLLGQDVLAAWPYTIDYRSAQLVLGTAQEPTATGVRLTLERRGASWLVQVPQSGGRAPWRLLPDSGADRLVLFEPTVRDVRGLLLMEPIRVRSVAGDRLGRRARIPELHIGALRLLDHEGLVLDGASPGGAMGDGLLPLHVFARASFNLAERSLVLEPRE